MPLAWEYVLLLLVLGSVAGFLAGLLGIGGGMILVPPLYYVFLQLGLAEHAMQLAIGTSLATIVFTGLSSGRAHYLAQRVDMQLWRQFIPGLLIGSACGAWMVDRIHTDVLLHVFAVLLLVSGAYLGLRSPAAAPVAQTVPPWRLRQHTFLAGFVSVMMGIGGGIPNTLLMIRYGQPLRTAIGTSAALTSILAGTSVLLLVAFGWHSQVNQPYLLGYVHVPVALCVVTTSMMAAPIGAFCSQRLPVLWLQRLLGLLLMLLAVKMLVKQYL
jgi:uncharacterized protein